jgi:tetratricopeptide (TPR) repeat protein
MDFRLCNSTYAVLSAILFLGCCQGAPARAMGILAATVIGERGEVTVERGGAIRFEAIQVEDVLYAGDTIRASNDAEADILFLDGSQVKLGANSEIKIPANGPAAASVNLFQAIVGVFWAHVRPNSKIESPSANVIVRGTDIALQVAEDGTTQLTVLNGDVSFDNQKGSVELTADEQSTASPGEAPTAPVIVDPTGLIAWTTDIVGLPLGYDTPQLAKLSDELYSANGRSSLLDDQLKSVPSDADGWIALADARRVVGDASGALAAYHAALGMDGQNVDACVGAALTELSQGRVSDARESLAAVAALAAPLAVAGLIDLESGNDSDADLAFESSLHLNPRDDSTLSLVALTYLQQGQFSLAEADAKRAVSIDPESSQTLATLSTVLFFEGKTKDAAELSRRAAKIAPNAPLSLLTEGRSAVVAGRFDRARAYYESALAFAPSLWLLHQELGDVYEQLDEPKKAVEEYRLALTLDPTSAYALARLGKAEQDLGDYAAAKSTFTKAVATDPSDAPVRYYYASFLVDRGDLEGALAQMNAVKSLFSSFGLLYARLAEIYLYKQDLSSAQAFAFKAVGLLPQSAIAHYELGRVDYEQQHTYQAEEEFRIATVLDPRLAPARYALGLVQEKTQSGLLESFASIFDSAYVGSPISSSQLKDIESPGANERTQAEIEDPTAIRSATRSYGNTELDGIAGTGGSYDAAASYLADTQTRGVIGVSGDTQFQNGIRHDDDTTINTANFVTGQKSNGASPGYVVLANYEETDIGEDNGITADPFLAASREHIQLLRITGGLNIRTGDGGRLLGVAQATDVLDGVRSSLLDNDPSGNWSIEHEDTDLVDGELRWDAMPRKNSQFTAGISYGDRHRASDAAYQNPVQGGIGTVYIPSRIKAVQGYLRETFNAGKQWSFIGQLQLASQFPDSYQHLVNPVAPIPNQYLSLSQSVILPYAVAAYQPDSSDLFRLRFRKITAYQNDFQLLSPTDDFLISYNDLPQALIVTNFGIATATSTEFEYDKTFRNASFLSIGAFDQDLVNADINSPYLAEIAQFGSATLEGVQTSYQTALSKFLTCSFLGEYADAEQTDVPGRILYIPQWVGISTLQYLNRSGGYCQLAYYYQGDRLVYDDQYNTIDGGSFGVLDLRVGKRVGLRSNIFGEINNAFDKQYDIVGIEQPRMELRAGISQRY